MDLGIGIISFYMLINFARVQSQWPGFPQGTQPNLPSLPSLPLLPTPPETPGENNCRGVTCTTTKACSNTQTRCCSSCLSRPDCSAVSCALPVCRPGTSTETPEGSCCPVCSPSTPDCSLIQCGWPTCRGGASPTTRPGDCCPSCPTDCSVVRCAMPTCPVGFTPETLPGNCCPSCPTDCSVVRCAMPTCLVGFTPETLPGDCCSSCQPAPATCPHGDQPTGDTCEILPCAVGYSCDNLSDGNLGCCQESSPAATCPHGDQPTGDSCEILSCAAGYSCDNLSDGTLGCCQESSPATTCLNGDSPTSESCPCTTGYACKPLTDSNWGCCPDSSSGGFCMDSDGNQIPSGSTFMNECSGYTCRNGQAVCTLIACPLCHGNVPPTGPPCETGQCQVGQICIPLLENYNRCCPDQSSGGNCTENGVTYQDSQTFMTDCNNCTCRNGVAGCTRIGCRPHCRSGQRCQSGQHCVQLLNNYYRCCLIPHQDLCHGNVPPSQHQCDGPNQCPAGHYCVSLATGLRCCPDQPSLTNPGVCPSPAGSFGICVEECDGDWDCGENEKCCSNGCGHVCTYVPPPGCTYKVTFYNEGEAISKKCEECTCSLGVVTQCTPVPCPPLRCTRPVQKTNDCCPTCPRVGHGERRGGRRRGDRRRWRQSIRDGRRGGRGGGSRAGGGVGGTGTYSK